MPNKNIYTVVVADDEDVLREAVCTMVPWAELGFSLVGSAGNGLDALQLVEKREPDLLLTDIRMPFISGIELARQVREIRPAMNIAFLSGYDDFEYAKQAIQYNIISYMLKPLTIEGLAAELRVVHQKIDAQFAMFRAASRPEEPAPVRQDKRAVFLMPLVLDEYAAPDPHTAAYAIECGLLQDDADRPLYTVMVTTLQSAGGAPGTTPAFAAAVDKLAAKYLRSVSFFSGGRIVSVLLGNRSDFEEYMHILADEIPQMADRVLGGQCRIGVSRATPELAGLHAAYREAMEALLKADPAEGGVRFISDLQPAVRGGRALCDRALAELDRHYMEADLSLVSLSGLLDVSPNHLSACIKKYAGETFINILIRKRMEAARRLLETTGLRVQEIAGRCGYLDQHYFSYCFKKYTGESPNALRRRLHAAGPEARP